VGKHRTATFVIKYEEGGKCKEKLRKKKAAGPPWILP
jgi:hypothetical protein